MMEKGNEHGKKEKILRHTGGGRYLEHFEITGFRVKHGMTKKVISCFLRVHHVLIGHKEPGGGFEDED